MQQGASLLRHVGKQIRELRENYDDGKGLSQEVLAKKLGTTANTVSRWETATYKPTLADLEALPKPEMIVFVLSAARVPNDDFTIAIADYARDVVYVEADDLTIPQGLLRAFRR